MDKPKITELTKVPKHTDDDAVACLFHILDKHRYVDPNEDKIIIGMPHTHSITLEGVTYQLVAAICIKHSAPLSSFYGFMPDGRCVIHTPEIKSLICDSWQEGYKMLVHDIRDHWMQIAYDAEVLAAPYKLLYDRLP